MKRILNLLIFATVVCSSILLAPVASSGDIYTWTDENGTQHFGARPPNGVRDFKMLKKGRITDDEESTDSATPVQRSAPAVSKEQDTTAKKKEMESEAATSSLKDEEAALNEKVRSLNCRKAQGVLRVLGENARVRVKNEQGEYEVLTVEQTKSRRESAEKIVAENC